MQTRQYKDLFALSTHLIGAVELTADEQTQLSTFIDRRYFEAFRKSPIWPRYTVYGERRKIASLVVRGATGTGASDINGQYYLLGTQKSGGSSIAKVGSNIYSKTTNDDDGSVTDGTLIFEQFATNNNWVINTSTPSVNLFSDGSLNVHPAGTTRYMEDATTGHKSAPYEVVQYNAFNSASGTVTVLQKQIIPFKENNKNDIGDFIRIHKTKPFLDRSAFEYDFHVNEDGADIRNLGTLDPQVAFVTYKKPFTGFGVTSGYTSSTVDVPEEFFNYIAHAAYADFLTMSGRGELAQTESLVAEKYLELELEKVNNINSTNTLSRISTHLSRQRRK